MEDTTLDALIQNYRPGNAAREAVYAAKIVLLVGISGAGKDTLKQALLNRRDFYNFVSHTTRQPRMNHGVMEVEAEDYFFISRTQAADMLRNGEFIEAKNYSSNIYGTSIKALKQDTDQIAVNDVEVQGVDEYKALSLSVKAVFILPPSISVWLQRFSARYEGGHMDEADIDQRKHTAVSELRFAIEKGYFDFLVNDSLEHSLETLEHIVHGEQSQADRDAGLRHAEKLLAELSTH